MARTLATARALRTNGAIATGRTSAISRLLGSFLLLDEFLDTRAAGTLNKTPAVNGPGLRTVVDTTNVLSITGGKAVFGGWNAIGDPALWYEAITRSAGVFLIFTTINSAGIRQRYGWDTNQSGNATEDVFSFDSTTTIRIFDNNTQTGTVGPAILGETYHLIPLLLSSGAQFLIRGGSQYPRWRLLWVSTAGATASVFPSVIVAETTGRLSLDRIARPNTTLTIAPTASDSFNRANGALGNTDGAGGGVTGGSGLAWTEQAGTWAISANASAASALVGGIALATVTSTTADPLVDVAVTRAANQAGLVARYIDASNYLYAYHDGTNAVLNQVLAGTTTTLITAAATYSAGARLRLALDGQNARLFYSTGATNLVGTTDSVMIAGQLSTKHGLYSSDTSNSLDSFVVWPLYPTVNLDLYGNFASGFAMMNNSWIADRTLTDAEGLSMVDVDGDGKIDVIVCDSVATPAVYWYKQVNPYSWTRYTIDAAGGSELTGSGGFAWGGGDVKVVTCDQDAQLIRIYAPTSLGVPTGTWTKTTLLSGRPNLQDITLWDIDGDGVPEIVYSWEGSTGANGGIHWLDFTGADATNPAHWTDHIMKVHPGAWRIAPRRLDLSGDGSANDIIFSARNGTGGHNANAIPGIYWLQRPADPTSLWTEFTIESRNVDWLNVDTGNFFGNGHEKDVIACEKDATYGLVRYNFSSAWAASTVTVPDLADDVFNVVTIPDNRYGGNRSAFLAFIKNSDAYVFRWSGTTYEYSPTGYITATHPPDNKLLWYDIDSDGVAELFIPDSDPSDGKMLWIGLG